jgi:hypothetical protein
MRYWRKERKTSSQYGLNGLGNTRATMVMTKNGNSVNWSKFHKSNLSTDWSLKLEIMKAESLVIANQHVAVNKYLGLVHTARHAMEIG